MTVGDIERLILLLARLPGLGPRSARRAALKMIQKPETLMLPLATAIQRAADAPASVGALILCASGEAYVPADDALALARRISEGKARRAFSLEPRGFHGKLHHLREFHAVWGCRPAHRCFQVVLELS